MNSDVDQDWLNAQTAAIKVITHNTAVNLWHIGQLLADVRQTLKSQFGAWLKTEFDWSQRTAYNLIAIWSRFPDKESIANVAPSALYLLAAASTPPEARDTAIRTASSGRQVTHTMARAIVARSRTNHTVGRKVSEPVETPSAGQSQMACVNQLTIAIRNDRLDYRQDRLTYALHELADLIKKSVPRHPPTHKQRKDATRSV